MKRMIFHIPMKIDRNRASASQIRPMKMIEAFKECGYEVVVVEGYGKERKRQIKEIKSNILKGVKYDFLYSESSTMPTLLTEKNHLPLYPFLDFSFFAFCKKHGIKIGLFYRDIYWVFKKKRSFKEWVAYIFYKYDILKYNKFLDVLFLPSKEMNAYIPNIKVESVIPLPSGLQLHSSPKIEHPLLELLFVGAIGGLYDITLLVKVISGIQGIHLTICCRENEWQKEKINYLPFLNEIITIVHKSGVEVEELYRKADISCIFFKTDKYLDFAVPYKLYESISYKCPVLANIDTLTGKYVQNNDIGIISSWNETQLTDVLNSITKEDLNKYQFQLNHLVYNNKWKVRCQLVEELLG